MRKLLGSEGTKFSSRHDISAGPDFRWDVNNSLPPGTSMSLYARDDPDDPSADYSERNKIGEQRVPHRFSPFPANADL